MYIIYKLYRFIYNLYKINLYKKLYIYIYIHIIFIFLFSGKNRATKPDSISGGSISLLKAVLHNTTGIILRN